MGYSWSEETQQLQAGIRWWKWSLRVRNVLDQQSNFQCGRLWNLEIFRCINRYESGNTDVICQIFDQVIQWRWQLKDQWSNEAESQPCYPRTLSPRLLSCTWTQPIPWRRLNSLTSHPITRKIVDSSSIQIRNRYHIRTGIRWIWQQRIVEYAALWSNTFKRGIWLFRYRIRYWNWEVKYRVIIRPVQSKILLNGNL